MYSTCNIYNCNLRYRVVWDEGLGLPYLYVYGIIFLLLLYYIYSMVFDEKHYVIVCILNINKTTF